VENAGRNETSVQPGYAVRPASERDIEAVVGLFERQEIGDHGRVTADWGHIVPFLFRSPGFNPAADARTMESEGSPVAFTGVFREDAEGLEPFMSWIVADPAHQSAALAVLLDWDVAHAAECGARALRHLAYRNDAPYRKLLLARGFRWVRSTWTMHRSLEDTERVHELADGIRISTFREDADDRSLFEAEQEAFSEHFGFVPETYERWRQRHFDEGDADREHWLLALDGDTVVGFLREVVGGDVAQVALLGTRPSWRGRGIATALLRTSFARMADSGHREVTLWVDSENETGAVGLYESVGMRSIVVDDTYELDVSARA
jgi:mycothiol synthase